MLKASVSPFMCEDERKFKMEDDEIERLAREELLREAQRASARAKIVGAQGWQKCAIPSPNKRFLQNTLMSTLSANKIGDRRRRDSSGSYDRDDRRKRRHSRDRYSSSSKKKSKQRSSDKESSFRKHRHSSSKDGSHSKSKKSKKSSDGDNRDSKEHKRQKSSKSSKSQSEHSHHSRSAVNGRTHDHGSSDPVPGPSRRNNVFLKSTPVVKRDVAT